MRFFIELSYNGKAYHGWQNQPNAISVQEVIEKSLSILLKEPIEIVGAGRTDSGVHSIQMFAHFDTTFELESEVLMYKLNAFLPKDIAINNIFEVNENSHARFDALNRTYLYRVTNKKDVFNFDKSYYFKTVLDLKKMNEACNVLFEHENFKCFSRSNTDVKTYNCKIMEAKWYFINDEYHFIIKADRFLRNMVRAIVGTMLDIGTGKLDIEDFTTIIQSQDRSKAGASAPAHGLYLSEITYPKSIYK